MTGFIIAVGVGAVFLLYITVGALMVGDEADKDNGRQ